MIKQVKRVARYTSNVPRIVSKLENPMKLMLRDIRVSKPWQNEAIYPYRSYDLRQYTFVNHHSLDSIFTVLIAIKYWHYTYVAIKSDQFRHSCTSIPVILRLHSMISVVPF